MRWVFILAVLVIVVVTGKRVIWPTKPLATVQRPVPVRTVKVVEQTVPVARTGVGTVMPVMSVTVKARVDGQLESVAFKEGQDVKAGQLLARIDPRTYQAQLDQNMAQKARDEAQLANARIDLARYEDLIKQDATTRQQLDTQRALVRQLEATIRNDQAQIDFARVNLSYTTITAPISGRAGARLVDPGNIVRSADASGLVVINQIDPIAVQFTLPEGSFQALSAAQRASRVALKVEALDRETHEVLAEGALALVDNRIDSATGTIALKAHFPNPAHRLWPGQAIDARLILGYREQALTVPAPVVQRGQNGLYAYVIDSDDKARQQRIDVADSANGLAVVTKGLTVGERVVVDGHYRLTPGAGIVETPTGGGSNAAEQKRP